MPTVSVPNPEDMRVISSDRVISDTYGLTIKGASIWPTKIFAVTETVSAPLIPINLAIILDVPFTRYCIKPR